VGLLLGGKVLAQSFEAFGRVDTSQSMSPRLRSNGILAVNGGVALPLGVMTFDDVTEVRSGFAQTGFSFTFLEADHFFHKHFGWGVRWTRHQFGFDHEGFADWFRIRAPWLDFYARSEDPWVTHFAMGQVVGIIPTEIVDVDLRIGLGYVYTRRPSILIEGYENATGFFSFSWQQEQAITNSVGWNFGSNFRFHIDRDIDLMFYWEYGGSRPNFQVLNIYARSNEEIEEWDQPIQFISMGGGLAIRL
jgi:hypothetical protein